VSKGDDDSTTASESEDDADEVVNVKPEQPQEDEDSDLNIFGDATNDSSTTVVVVETEEVDESNQELLAQDDSEKVTEVRTVVVEQVSTSGSVSSKNYLVIIGIVIIAFVIILALICLIKRCRKVDERAPVAEFVDKERDKAKFVDEEFTNIGGVFGRQYTPKPEMLKDGFCLGKQSSKADQVVEGTEEVVGADKEPNQDPPQDMATDRNLLDEKDVAPVQMTEKELAYVL